MQKTRTEKDLLGERTLLDDAYYGIQTLRALENFQISGKPISTYPIFIKNLALVKKAAAHTNFQLGLLSPLVFEAIDFACNEIIEGKYLNSFPVDLYQGGAGTSTNMNANEVIANIALIYLGEEKGNYQIISPNDHVNLSQSTNDVYPTALKLAVFEMHQNLIPALATLQKSLHAKSVEFADVIKMGRTQLQDAVPMTLGQEFDGFSYLIKTAIKDLKRASESLLEVNMGATAIGTGINAPANFDLICAKQLALFSEYKIHATPNLIAATSDTTCFVEYASSLKKLALRLIKIANDLRLLASGPRTGLYEIQLPKMQPGSSIMPGKVNPVIPEVLNQICYKVIGNELTITLAAENAQLQLNVMEPVIALSLFESIQLLHNGIQCFTENCIVGIIANKEHALAAVKNSIGIVTALNPFIGYKVSTQVAKEALAQNKNIATIVKEKGLLSDAEIEQYLDPKNMLN